MTEIENVPYKLPEGWKWVKLSTIIELRYGKGLSKKNRKVGSIPVYGSNGIIGYHNKSLIDIPTIIVGRKGSVGKVNLVIMSSWPIDTAFYISFKGKDISINYLYYYLSILEDKLIFPKGVKPGINRNEYLKNVIPIPFKNGKPDLEKQKEIVEKIDEIFERIKKAEELKQKSLEKTKLFFNSILNKIFKEAKEENWKWVKVKNLIKKETYNLGKLQTSKYQKIGKFPIIDQGQKFIIGYSDKESAVYDSSLPVILLGDHTLNIKYVDFPFIQGADGLKVLIPSEEESLPKFFYYMLMYVKPPVKKYMRHFKKIKDLLVPIPFKDGKPDLEKQKQIAEYLDKLSEKVKQLEELQELELEKLKSFKESILNKAFRGELI